MLLERRCSGSSEGELVVELAAELAVELVVEVLARAGVWTTGARQRNSSSVPILLEEVVVDAIVMVWWLDVGMFEISQWFSVCWLAAGG